MKKLILLVICLSFLIVGCGPKIEKNSITELREFTFEDYCVVGVGEWINNNSIFRVTSYEGTKWDVPVAVKIYEQPVTLESFKRVTRP